LYTTQNLIMHNYCVGAVSLPNLLKVLFFDVHEIFC